MCFGGGCVLLQIQSMAEPAGIPVHPCFGAKTLPDHGWDISGVRLSKDRLRRAAMCGSHDIRRKNSSRKKV